MINYSFLTSFLAPFLPHILDIAKKTSKQFSDKLSTELGNQALEKAKYIWSKIKPKVDSNKSAKAAFYAVAENPEDKDMRSILERQLETLLKEDTVLRNEIESILKEIQETKEKETVTDVITIESEGNENINIGKAEGNFSIHSTKKSE